MTPEERILIQEAVELSKENNKILKKMQRRASMEAFFKVVYWGVMIAAVVGAYYSILPYYDQLKTVYMQMQTNIETVKSGLDTVTNSVEKVTETIKPATLPKK